MAKEIEPEVEEVKQVAPDATAEEIPEVEEAEGVQRSNYLREELNTRTISSNLMIKMSMQRSNMTTSMSMMRARVTKFLIILQIRKAV